LYVTCTCCCCCACLPAFTHTSWSSHLQCAHLQCSHTEPHIRATHSASHASMLTIQNRRLRSTKTITAPTHHSTACSLEARPSCAQKAWTRALHSVQVEKLTGGRPGVVSSSHIGRWCGRHGCIDCKTIVIGFVVGGALHVGERAVLRR